MTQTLNKTMVTRAVITKIEEEYGPQKIKAKHVMGYQSPDKIAFEGKKEGFTPDIAAVYENSTTLYEIELNRKMPVEKWRLLSLYAKKNSGNLYLIVPDFLKESIKEEIKENEINAGVIFFNT